MRLRIPVQGKLSSASQHCRHPRTRRLRRTSSDSAGSDWIYATKTLPTQYKTMAYLAFDEIQELYNDERSPPRCKSTSFWPVVKRKLGNAGYNIRILMFAAYGCDVVYLPPSSPLSIDERCILGIDDLKFSRDEVVKYITKWFQGVLCFEGASSSFEEFCTNLEEWTDGHVGLCSTGVDALNEVFASRNQSSIGLPSPAEWIRMMQSGSLYRTNDNALFERLISTRAVKVLEDLDLSDLDRLERLTYGGNTDYERAVVKKYLRKGILVRSDGWFKFLSSMIWRFFAKKRLSAIVRAVDSPITLPGMINRAMHSMDYGNIREWVIRNVWGEVPLERVWQMEFYKAVYRCTPSTFKTSVDDGSLFGSSEFIDLTVRQDEIVWGVKLLREVSNLADHVERLSPGGRYSSLPLGDFCLIDFRHVASIDNLPMERIAEDMRACDKLFVVCYDDRMAVVVVVNSAMDVHRISSSKKH